MRPALYLEEEMGESMGGSEILQRPVQEKQKTGSLIITRQFFLLNHHP
jgi:hypothetical protein